MDRPLQWPHIIYAVKDAMKIAFKYRIDHNLMTPNHIDVEIPIVAAAMALMYRNDILENFWFIHTPEVLNNVATEKQSTMFSEPLGPNNCRILVDALQVCQAAGSAMEDISGSSKLTMSSIDVIRDVIRLLITIQFEHFNEEAVGKYMNDSHRYSEYLEHVSIAFTKAYPA